MHERLALGSVQFGMPYGIANDGAQVSKDEVARIIERARDAGVDTIDTAIAYGESERCLGEVGVADFRVITKLPGLPPGVADATAWVTESIEGSLTRLRLPGLYGVLLHRPADLLGPHGGTILDSLLTMQQSGLIEKIGISTYGPEEIAASEPHFQMQLVQTPLNIFDRQIVSSGWLHRLKQAGVEVHTRSAFLQGLLLLPEGRRPRLFDAWGEHFDRWDRWLEDTGRTALQQCLGFVLDHRNVDRVVVGVDSLTHFEEILEAAKYTAFDYPADLESTDKNLIYPALWRA